MTKILALSFIAIAAVSCGSGGSSKTEVSRNDAPQIIEYYNNALSVFQNGYEYDDCEEVIEFMSNNGKARIKPLLVEPTLFKDSAKMTTPGDYFGKGAGDSLRTAFRAYYAASAKFKDNYQVFQEYVKSEDFKDDDWAKGKQLTAENETALQQIRDAKAQVISLISEPADQAEIALLAENPLKDHIILGKHIFAQMDSLMNDVAQEEVNPQAVTTNYDALELLVKNGRALPAVKDMDNEMKWYGEYLGEVDSFLGIVRKAQRDNKYTQSVLNDMDYQYGRVVSDYNTFVD